MDQPERSETNISSIVKSIEIIDYVLESKHTRITDISTNLGIPKSTVHRYVKTLENQGILVKRENSYQVSLKLLYYGKIIQNMYDPENLIYNNIVDLSKLTEERVQFMILEDDKMVYVYRELGQRGVDTSTIAGKKMPLHATSGGKVILATLPERKRTELIERLKLERYTENTITSKDELFEELVEIRQDGYSINREEYIDGLRAVSVPVRLFDGQVFGAIGVSGPKHRIKGKITEQDLVERLQGTANEIELKYDYVEPPVPEEQRRL